MKEQNQLSEREKYGYLVSEIYEICFILIKTFKKPL